MAVRLDDANIEVRLDREKALAELRTFEEEVREARQRASDESAREDDERARERREVSRELDRTGEKARRDTDGITSSLRSFVRSVGNLAASTGAGVLTTVAGGPGAPGQVSGQVLRAAVQAARLTAELGPDAARGVIEGLDLPGGAAVDVVQALASTVQQLGDKLAEIETTVQAFGATFNQARSIGLALARTPAGKKIDPAFFKRVFVGEGQHGGLFEYNKLEKQRQRRAQQASVRFVFETLAAQGSAFAK